jgi:CRISPR-associated endonuclease/helicase Cas3
LLAHVGVGTIDQALLAVLPVRHATLRLQGLKSKVLVVDEAHAFDPYMRRELVELLRFHAALGGSAILLSATLPKATRQMLVDAFRDGLGAAKLPLICQDYPLATVVGTGSTIVEQHCGVRTGLGRKVAITRLPDVDSALQRITQAASAGAAIAWIRNTVDDALTAAALLRAHGLEPLVFHARFALCDRLDVETEVLLRFGRDSAGAQRRCVLVATQVIEQSLDLDFDLLCTDLAPLDRLIQRAGRLWRHARTERPLPRSEMLVISPEPVDAPEMNWIKDLLPGTAAVYRDPALLWRSARAIFGSGVLATPEDMRPLIEVVADIVADGAVPPALAAAAALATGKDMSAAAIARQNVLKLNDGYRPDAGAWEPDTYTPTRLEDQPRVTLRLALQREGRLVPYARTTGDIRRAGSLSEVTVARHRLPICPVSPALAAMVEVAKKDWGQREREIGDFLIALLEMTSEADSYTLHGWMDEGSKRSLRYTPRQGLCWYCTD